MTTALRICGIAFIVAVLCWLVWLSNALLDLREWAEQALTGRPHGEVADDVDQALRRFSFGGGNDGRNFAVSDARTVPGVHGHAGGTQNGSARRTGRGNGNSEEARTHGE